MDSCSNEIPSNDFLPLKNWWIYTIFCPLELARTEFYCTTLLYQPPFFSSVPSRDSNPVHTMTGLKRDFPLVNKVFRKYLIFPATQNADERLFSLVGKMTRPQSRRIKTTTIEKKYIVVSSTIQTHGFIFNYLNGNETNSSEEHDSFCLLFWTRELISHWHSRMKIYIRFNLYRCYNLLYWITRFMNLTTCFKRLKAYW